MVNKVSNHSNSQISSETQSFSLSNVLSRIVAAVKRSMGCICSIFSSEKTLSPDQSEKTLSPDEIEKAEKLLKEDNQKPNAPKEVTSLYLRCAREAKDSAYFRDLKKYFIEFQEEALKTIEQAEKNLRQWVEKEQSKGNTISDEDMNLYRQTEKYKENRAAMWKDSNYTHKMLNAQIQSDSNPVNDNGN